MYLADREIIKSSFATHPVFLTIVSKSQHLKPKDLFFMVTAACWVSLVVVQPITIRLGL